MQSLTSTPGWQLAAVSQCLNAQPSGQMWCAHAHENGADVSAVLTTQLLEEVAHVLPLHLLVNVGHIHRPAARQGEIPQQAPQRSGLPSSHNTRVQQPICPVHVSWLCCCVLLVADPDKNVDQV